MNKNLDAWAASLPESDPSTPHDRAVGFIGAVIVAFVLWGIIISVIVVVAT